MQHRIYRETISRAAEARVSVKNQSISPPEFAVVTIRLEPLPRGAGLEFVNRTHPDVMLPHHIAGVEEGVRDAAEAGVLSGGPVQDLRAILLDGAYHEIDSYQRTFRAAAKQAFLKAMRDAHPKYLLP